MDTEKQARQAAKRTNFRKTSATVFKRNPKFRSGIGSGTFIHK